MCRYVVKRLGYSRISIYTNDFDKCRPSFLINQSSGALISLSVSSNMTINAIAPVQIIAEIVATPRQSFPDITVKIKDESCTTLNSDNFFTQGENDTIRVC